MNIHNFQDDFKQEIHNIDSQISEDWFLSLSKYESNSSTNVRGKCFKILSDFLIVLALKMNISISELYKQPLTNLKASQRIFVYFTQCFYYCGNEKVWLMTYFIPKFLLILRHFFILNQMVITWKVSKTLSSSSSLSLVLHP